MYVSIIERIIHCINMTIVLDGRALQGAYGGIDVYAHKIFEHLIRLAPQNTYILYFNGSKKVDVERFASFPNIKIIQTRIPSRLFNASLMLLGFPKLDQYLQWLSQERIDLFFMPNMNFASFSSRAKVVVTVHDLSYLLFRRHQSFRSMLWHAAIRPVKLLSRARALIAVSDNTRNDIVSNYHIDPSHISSISLGGENETNVNVVPMETLPIILAFCPQESRKNIRTLLEAFARAREADPELRETVLMLAGVRNISSALKKSITSLGIEKSVRIVPYLPNEKRSRLFRSARLCVYPSIYEGFGLPPLEALSYGIPVIAGAHSSIPSVSGDGVWYCDPYNVNELAESIHIMYGNDTIRKILIQRGRVLPGGYSWDRTAQETLTLFTKVCESA